LHNSTPRFENFHTYNLKEFGMSPGADYPDADNFLRVLKPLPVLQSGTMPISTAWKGAAAWSRNVACRCTEMPTGY
jgi:hypothetical protein